MHLTISRNTQCFEGFCGKMTYRTISRASDGGCEMNTFAEGMKKKLYMRNKTSNIEMTLMENGWEVLEILKKVFR